MTDEPAGAAGSIMLEAVVAEIEAFVGHAGWDSGPTLFALVPTHLLATDPQAGDTVLDPADAARHPITPVAQDDLPDTPLDELLAQIGWPDQVIGCALSQEILMLPPSAETELADSGADPVATAVAHPDRQEARLVVAVLRDGSTATVLRLRGRESGGDDLLTGPDLAPNLAEALYATLRD